MTEILYDHGAAFIAGGLAVGMLTALECGYRLGRPAATRAGEALRAHINSVQTSLLGLLALIIGFTFALALQHYDARSAAVVTEANAIGTTWLRSGLLSGNAGSEVRELLRRYVDARITESHIPLSQLTRRAGVVAQDQTLLDQLWQATVHIVARDSGPVTSGLFVQSLNDTIDAFGSNNAVLDRHMPEIVLWILFATFGVTAAVLGYSASVADHRPPLATMLLITLIVLVTYLIIDLDRPRRGLIRVSQTPLLELQQAMAGTRTP